MADHRGYWTEVGRGLVEEGRRGAGWLGRTGALTSALIVVGALGLVTLLVGITSHDPLTAAPSEEVPSYHITSTEDYSGGTGPLSGLHFTVESEEYGEGVFRDVARDVRYKHPEHELVVLHFMYYDTALGTYTEEGIVAAVSDSERAREVWADLPEEEIDAIVDEKQGVEVLLYD